jgi:polyisoprenoid-binding protein YceI
VALVVAAVVVAAAGWWFFIREDAKLATNAPAVPTDLVDATATPKASGGSAAPAPAGAVTFRIIADRSEAAYFVGETLASLGLPSTAKGTTNDVQGEFSLTGDGAALAPGTSSFTVGLTSLKSNESRRDSRVQTALQTSRFPKATFTISSVTGYNAAIPEGTEQTLRLTGTMDLHGVQREVTWEVKAIRQGSVITALATVTIKFADFNITPPNIGGFVSVGDEATLQVQLVAQAVKGQATGRTVCGFVGLPVCRFAS